MSDTLTDGRRFRTLCVINDFTREALEIYADSDLLPAKSLVYQVNHEPITEP